MNLNEGLFANFGELRRNRNPRNNRLNVVIIQNGGIPKNQRAQQKNIFDSTSFSDLKWRSGTECVTEFNTSTSSRTLNTTSELESKLILAVTEGRGDAMCEVGISAINIQHPVLILCQLSDTQSYSKVLSKINYLNPYEILVPVTMSNSRLTAKIKEQFPHVKMSGVQRSTFNKSTGMQYIRHLCAPIWNSIFLILQYKYYALTATSGLLSYIETYHYTYFTKESLKVEYQESDGYMIIDVFTADKLELVSCALLDGGNKYSSLYSVLNHCVTKVGARLLRSSILQPPCSVDEIEGRLNCVEELLKHPENIIQIQGLLKKISNINQLLNLSTIVPDDAQNCSGKHLNYILLLNSFFDLLEPLQKCLEDSNQPFFIDIQNTLLSSDFIELKNILQDVIHPNAQPGKGEQGVIERCFAIKVGVCEILDLIRNNYTNRLNEMREYVKGLANKYNLDLKLSNNSKKGYHIVLPLGVHQRRTFKKSDLNEEFIQIDRMTTMVTMKTIDILTYSARLDDIVTEILNISNITIYKLLLEVKSRIGLFYKLCDDIAKLDMLQSLASASNCNKAYVRPYFNEFTEVINGRHPMLDYLCDTDPIANDMLCSPQYNMHIITGPNGAGKSIYIRQIVLLQVMAQVGSFIPADSATFRIADRILARIYLEDNMNCGASAFVLEMKEIQYFMNVMTKNTLIIIDELCRSTSIEEGTALAMAICEYFLHYPAFVYFTTHYTFITKLYDMYLNVKCWQLEAKVVENEKKKSLIFMYKVIPGVTSLKEYAIYLAKASWDEHTMKDVEYILTQLEMDEDKTTVKKLHPASRLKYDLESELQILKYKKQLTVDVLFQKLADYRRDMIEIVNEYSASESCLEIEERSHQSFCFVKDVVEPTKFSENNLEELTHSVHSQESFVKPHRNWASSQINLENSFRNEVETSHSSQVLFKKPFRNTENLNSTSSQNIFGESSKQIFQECSQENVQKSFMDLETCAQNNFIVNLATSQNKFGSYTALHQGSQKILQSQKGHANQWKGSQNHLKESFTKTQLPSAISQQSFEGLNINCYGSQKKSQRKSQDSFLNLYSNPEMFYPEIVYSAEAETSNFEIPPENQHKNSERIFEDNSECIAEISKTFQQETTKNCLDFSKTSDEVQIALNVLEPSNQNSSQRPFYLSPKVIVEHFEDDTSTSNEFLFERPREIDTHLFMPKRIPNYEPSYADCSYEALSSIKGSTSPNYSPKILSKLTQKGANKSQPFSIPLKVNREKTSTPLTDNNPNQFTNKQSLVNISGEKNNLSPNVISMLEELETSSEYFEDEWEFNNQTTKKKCQKNIFGSPHEESLHTNKNVFKTSCNLSKSYEESNLNYFSFTDSQEGFPCESFRISQLPSEEKSDQKKMDIDVFGCPKLFTEFYKEKSIESVELNSEVYETKFTNLNKIELAEQSKRKMKKSEESVKDKFEFKDFGEEIELDGGFSKEKRTKNQKIKLASKVDRRKSTNLRKIELTDQTKIGKKRNEGSQQRKYEIKNAEEEIQMEEVTNDESRNTDYKGHRFNESEPEEFEEFSRSNISEKSKRYEESTPRKNKKARKDQEILKSNEKNSELGLKNTSDDSNKTIELHDPQTENSRLKNFEKPLENNFGIEQQEFQMYEYFPEENRISEKELEETDDQIRFDQKTKIQDFDNVQKSNSEEESILYSPDYSYLEKLKDFDFVPSWNEEEEYLKTKLNNLNTHLDNLEDTLKLNHSEISFHSVDVTTKTDHNNSYATTVDLNLKSQKKQATPLNLTVNLQECCKLKEETLEDVVDLNEFILKKEVIKNIEDDSINPPAEKKLKLESSSDKEKNNSSTSSVEILPAEKSKLTISSDVSGTTSNNKRMSDNSPSSESSNKEKVGTSMETEPAESSKSNISTDISETTLVIKKTTESTTTNGTSSKKTIATSFGSLIKSDSSKSSGLKLPAKSPFEDDQEVSFNLSSNSSEKRRKFKTPVKSINKLTRKEIEESFRIKDLANLSGANAKKYCNEILNRPNVKQIQASSPLVTAHRTKSGCVVIPKTQNVIKRVKHQKFMPPLKKCPVGKQFNVQLFSDRNSDIYDEFIKTRSDAEFDFTKFDCIPERNVGKFDGVRSETAQLTEPQPSTSAGTVGIEGLSYDREEMYKLLKKYV